MPARTPAIAAAAERVGQFILIIRRQRVLLDEDLAALRESQAISNFRAGYHQQYLAKNRTGIAGLEAAEFSSNSRSCRWGRRRSDWSAPDYRVETATRGVDVVGPLPKRFGGGIAAPRIELHRVM
jgi:hypothetical protein